MTTAENDTRRRLWGQAAAAVREDRRRVAASVIAAQLTIADGHPAPPFFAADVSPGPTGYFSARHVEVTFSHPPTEDFLAELDQLIVTMGEAELLERVASADDLGGPEVRARLHEHAAGNLDEAIELYLLGLYAQDSEHGIDFSDLLKMRTDYLRVHDPEDERHPWTTQVRADSRATVAVRWAEGLRPLLGNFAERDDLHPEALRIVELPLLNHPGSDVDYVG